MGLDSVLDSLKIRKILQQFHRVPQIGSTCLMAYGSLGAPAGNLFSVPGKKRVSSSGYPGSTSEVLFIVVFHGTFEILDIEAE